MESIRRELKVKKTMKKVALVVGLCLGISLQSMDFVEAAVNYEACPFCGTRVERYTTTKLLLTQFVMACAEHSNCEIHRLVYHQFDISHCQTAECYYSSAPCGDPIEAFAHISK